MLPFVLLLLCLTLDRRVFLAMCIAIGLSSFLSVGRSGLEAGPIFADHTARSEQMKYIQRIIQAGTALPHRAVVVSGWWYPRLWATLVSDSAAQAQFVYALDLEGLHKYQRDGFTVYYLPGMVELNRDLYGVDLRALDARPLLGEN